MQNYYKNHKTYLDKLLAINSYMKKNNITK